MTGLQNAISAAIIEGKDSENTKKKARQIFNDILSDMNLSDEMIQTKVEKDKSKNKDFIITEMSGGQRQRLSFARAILSTYTILFADEPTGDLDWKNSDILMEYLKNHMPQNGAGIIVSHDIELALRFADKIVLLEKNKDIINNRKIYYGKITNSSTFEKINNKWSSNETIFNNSQLLDELKSKFV